MAKKKLSHDQKRKQKKQKRQKSPVAINPMHRMSRRIKEMGIDNYKVVRPPAGAAKMSEVLMEFIAPYMEYADNTEAMHKVIITAIVAWNTALLPQTEQADSLLKFTKTLPADAVEDFEAIVEEMIERKNKHFAHYTRHIVNYDLIDRGRGDYYISVASTLDEEGEK